MPLEKKKIIRSNYLLTELGYIIGDIKDLDNKNKSIIVCKDFASGASLSKATNKTVVVGFDDQNSLWIAEYLRKRNPEIDIIIAIRNE